MKLVVRAFLVVVFLATALTVTLLSFLPPPGEYEIVSIDTRTWVVSARGEDGADLNFSMHPSIFKGRCFNANLTGVSTGSVFSIVGPPGERFDGVEVRSFSGKGAGAANRSSRRPSRRANTRGMQRYCVTEVDAAGQTVTATAGSGQAIRFKVDSGGFRGYRVQVPSVAQLATGGRFSLNAPNEAAVRCCTLLEGPK